MNKNYLNLSFRIWGHEDIDNAAISESLDVSPHTVHNKRKDLALAGGSWEFSPNANDASFEEQLNRILDVLEPKVSVLKKHAQKYYCEFLCVVFLNTREGSTPWIHFCKRYNAFIREVDVKFKLEICFSKK